MSSQPRLRRLALPYSSGYSDETLLAVAQHCPRLASVVLNNGALTDVGVIPLLRACSLLRSIDVSECSLLTSAVLDTIVELGRDMTLVNVRNTGISGSAELSLSKIPKDQIRAVYFDC